MKLSGTINILRFDSDAYTKAFRKALEIQMRQATRAFLRAAIPLVPVQTGMARGAFLNIGRFLNVAVPITPTVFGKFYYPGRLPKTAETGALLTTHPEDIITIEGDRITLHIDTQIIHLALEDIIGVHSGPWGSFEAGRKAFIKAMKNIKQRLPKIKSYITRTKVTF